MNTVKGVVYILKSTKDKKHYIGHTTNLSERLNDHNLGYNRSTKHRGEFDIVYFERTPTLAEAFAREKYIKNLGTKRFLGRAGLNQQAKNCTFGA